jgi:TRIAD3 protein (E3 ubiquitin-protein ligase RNF216)
VSELYQKVGQSSDRLIAHILDKIENGGQYPKTKDKQKTLKRKRNIDEDEEAAKKYGSVDRVVPNTVGGIRPYIRSILQQEFALTPVVFIDATLSQNHYRLFSAYRILEEAQRTYDSIPPPYNMIKTARKMDPLLREAAVNSYLEKPDLDHEKFEVLKELQAARRIKKKADARREVERQKEREEEDNVRKAEAEGTMTECGCCCCDYPLNRMVHCDGDEMHWFCRNCARTTAEVEIGKSKYELRCMSTDKCEAGFAMDQRYASILACVSFLMKLGSNSLTRKQELPWKEMNKKRIYDLLESRI